MGGKRNDFAAFFGKNIFEAYVGMHLRKLYKKGRVLTEQRYKKNSHDTSDWIVIDSNAIVLVECKTSDLTKEAKTFAEQEQLLADLKKRVIKGITTCHRTAEDAKQKVEGLDDLSHVNSFHYLVVTADYSFSSNSSVYRSLIDTELQKTLGTIPRYHVISISDFEDIFSYLEEYSLSELLAYKSKMKNGTITTFSPSCHNLLEAYAEEKFQSITSY
jgi:hypothetical protein